MFALDLAEDLNDGDLIDALEGDIQLFGDATSRFGDLDYKTYMPGQSVPECGKCFWCKEREWAIRKAEN